MAFNLTRPAIKAQRFFAIDVREYGAIGNGVADDTTAMQQAFTDALAIGLPIFIPKGRFSARRLELAGTGTESIELFGPGMIEMSVSEDVEETLPGISLNNFARVTAQGLNLKYTGPFDPFGNSRGRHSLLEVADSQNVVVDKVHARGASHAGIRILRCEDVIVQACNSCQNRGSGLSISTSKSIQVLGGFYHENGIVTDTGTGYGIVLPGNNPGLESSRVIITGVHAHRNHRKGIDVHSGRYIEVSSCQTFENTIMGIMVQSSSTQGNTFRCNTIRIHDNIVKGQPESQAAGNRGISAGGSTTNSLCDSVDVYNNELIDVRDVAIHIFTGGVKTVSVKGNRINGVRAGAGGSSIGIFVGQENKPELTEILDNTIRNTRLHIQANDATTTKIRGNNFLIPAKPWVASTAYQEGDVVRPVGGGSVFRVVDNGSGITGTTQPTWPTTYNTPVVDGTVTWELQSPAEFRGLRLGASGLTVEGVLQLNNNHFDTGWSETAISGSATRQVMSRNTLGQQDMHPEPIRVSVPIRTMAGTETWAEDLFFVPASHYVEVVAAGGRRLSSVRVARLILGGVEIYSQISELFSLTNNYTRTSSGGSSKLLQIQMTNGSAASPADMSASFLIRIAPLY